MPYVDFYMRPATDPNYVPNVYVVSNELENLVEQIKMTLLTNRGEVLGDTSFGFGAYDYLFDTNSLDTNSLQNAASQQIVTYATLAAKRNVTTTASVFAVQPFRNAIGLGINIGDAGKFGILFD